MSYFSRFKRIFSLGNVDAGGSFVGSGTDSQFLARAQDASTNIVTARRVAGDTFDRYQSDADGDQRWGSGALTPDTSQARIGVAIVAFNSGLATSVWVGAVGPSGEPGIAAGALGDTVWYRGGSNYWKTPDDIQIDGQTVAAGEFVFRRNLVGHTNTNSGANYNLLSTDTSVYVDTTGGAVTVNLPAGGALGRIVIIKDAFGNAAANNITIATDDATLIDGDPTATLANDYGSLIIQNSNAAWSIIGSHLP